MMRIVMAELLLGVNIDHIATLRNARGTAYRIRCRRRCAERANERHYRAFT
ncbi:MAG: pyridoxine 5'-phosphate synthase [Escherichia sp.]